MTKEKTVQLLGPNQDGIVTILIDQPGKKVNVLNTDLMPEFHDLMDEASGNNEVKAIIIASGKPNGFIAGADINMLDGINTVEEGQAISQSGQEAMNRIAALDKPVVAAIHGDCLGGGLELALACHARVASNSAKTKLALPEVMLGLLPGSGGTRRLPKLIGLANALDMMLTGRNIRAKKALKMGLVDQIVPVHKLLGAAEKMALRLLKGKKPSRPKKSFNQNLVSLALEKNPIGRNLVFSKSRKMVMSKSHGLYPAPLKIIDAVKADTDEAESKGFGELLLTKQSVGLRHLFHCITELKKDDGPNTGDVEPYDVSHVGMLGAGLMGGGIATVLADKGITVRLKDIHWDGVNHALDYAKKVYKKAVKRKRYGKEGFAQRFNRLSGGLDFDGIGNADVVIEAVPEKLSLKKEMVAKIEALSDQTGRPIIFATNTSSLPISKIAEDAKYPDRIIGMHFFSPVEKMPLVELIVTDKTDPKVTKTISKLARLMGKHVIVVHDCAGFYTTRVLGPYMNEAIFMMLEGHAIEDIDAAALAVGFPVGPITLMDEVGIDVGVKVTAVLSEYYGDRMEFPNTDVTDQFISDGRLGRKANKGFYVYENGKSVLKGGKKQTDPNLKSYMDITPVKPDFEEMGRRLVLAFLNEAALCLQEGILRDPMSGDLGAIMGIGFPPFEGGPFQYVDRIGAAEVVSQMTELSTKYGKRFEPCDLLQQKAKNQELFHS